MVTHSCTKKTSSPKMLPKTATKAVAIAMETTAKPMGISAATTAPNSTSRMSIATGMPMRSPCTRSDSAISPFSNAMVASPTTRTRKPSRPSASSTTWMISSAFSVA